MSGVSNRLLFAAVEKRIAERGDMEIDVSALTFERLVRACGFKWDTYDMTCARTIDAIALSMLLHMAGHSR